MTGETQGNIPRYRPASSPQTKVRPAYGKSAIPRSVGSIDRLPLPPEPTFADATLDDILSVSAQPSTDDLFHFQAGAGGNMVVQGNTPILITPKSRVSSWMVRNLDPNQTITGWFTKDKTPPNGTKYWTLPASQVVGRETSPSYISIQPSTAGTTQQFEVELWYL